MQGWRRPFSLLGVAQSATTFRGEGAQQQPHGGESSASHPPRRRAQAQEEGAASSGSDHKPIAALENECPKDDADWFHPDHGWRCASYHPLESNHEHCVSDGACNHCASACGGAACGTGCNVRFDPFRPYLRCATTRKAETTALSEVAVEKLRTGGTALRQLCVERCSGPDYTGSCWGPTLVAAEAGGGSAAGGTENPTTFRIARIRYDPMSLCVFPPPRLPGGAVGDYGRCAGTPNGMSCELNCDYGLRRTDNFLCEAGGWVGEPRCVAGGGDGAAAGAITRADGTGRVGEGGHASGTDSDGGGSSQALQLALIAAFTLLFGLGMWQYAKLRASWAGARAVGVAAARTTKVVPGEPDDEETPSTSGVTKGSTSEHKKAARAEFEEDGTEEQQRKSSGFEKKKPRRHSGRGNSNGGADSGGSGTNTTAGGLSSPQEHGAEDVPPRWSPPPSPEIGTNGHGGGGWNVPNGSPEFGGPNNPPGVVLDPPRDLADYADSRVPKILDQVDLELGQAEASGDPDLLKKQIRRLQLTWHPDKNLGSKELATEIFQYIQEEWVQTRLGKTGADLA